MQTDDSQRDGNHEKRWGFVLQLLRMGIISIKNKPLHIFLTVISQASIFLIFFGSAMYAVQNVQDVQKVFNALRAVGTIAIVEWTHLCLRFLVCDLERLIEVADQFPLDEIDNAGTEAKKLKKAGRGSRIIKFIKVTIAIMAVQHSLNTIVTSLVYRRQVLPVYLGYDVNLSPMFEIVNAAQIITVTTGLATLGVFPSVYAILMCIACNEMEKLRNNFRDVKQEYPKDEMGQEEVFVTMNKKLGTMISQHQKLLRFFHALQENLHIPIFGMLFLYAANMCVSAFSILMCKTTADLTQSTILYFMFVCAAGVYCWFGSDLSTEVEKLKHSVLDCDFVGAPVSVQRSLIPIMAMSDHGFQIKSANLIAVNNETLNAMLNHTISFFLFLKNVMDSNDK